MAYSDFIGYNEAVVYIAKNFNIKTQRDYFKVLSGRSKEIGLPSNPRKFYGENWLGWGDFLGTKRLAYLEKKFYSVDEFLSIIKKNEILTKRQYQKSYKLLGDDKLPSNPDKQYNLKWSFILNKKKKQFLNYIDGKKYVIELGLKSVKDYENLIKNNDINLPFSPNYYYKEWTSWMDWLGTNNKIKRHSRGHVLVREHLNKFGVNFIEEKNFNGCLFKKKLYFDFYLIDFNTCIEYDGIQHFQSVERFGGQIGYEIQTKKDEIKNNFCKRNNIELIRIKYTDCNMIGDILCDYLKRNKTEYGII
jgi:hypothetical protein